jgi:hypothetical protein
MTAPAGWWCPTCGHTQVAPVGDQPDPEPAQQWCTDCNSAHVPDGSCPVVPPGSEHDLTRKDRPVPVGDDTPAPTEAPCWATDGEPHWHADEERVVWHQGDGWAIADISIYGIQGDPDEAAAYDALVALVRRAGAAPDLTALAAAARNLSETDDAYQHHADSCGMDPCATCEMWSHRSAEAWASLRARIAEVTAVAALVREDTP